MKKRNCCN